jgi:recombination protein RecA
VVKNRFAPCPQTLELDIMYNNGIIKAGEIFDLGSRLKTIVWDGAAYIFQGFELGKDRDQVLSLLVRQMPISNQIELAIRQELFSTAPIPPARVPGVGNGERLEDRTL